MVTHDGAMRRKRRGFLEGPALLVRGFGLAGLGIVEALLSAWVIAVVSLCCCLGLGIPLVPSMLDATRREAQVQRRLARSWCGVPVEAAYLPESQTPQRPLRRAARMLTDSATWRDVLWVLINPYIGPIMALLPVVFVVHGMWGLLMPFLWRTITEDWGWSNSWYEFIPLNSQFAANLAAGLGAVELLLGLFVLPRLLLRVHGEWVRLILGATRSALATRVDQLTDSRADAMRMQANELRRIERDLHDGAQARLVALGMTLSTAQSLIDQHPDAARGLLAEAKDSSIKALNELRDLVHGVHPPVLADRGLFDAVRTLALELPTPVQVIGFLPERLPAPIESAAYFAIAELLTNATKHAGATTVEVVIWMSEQTLHAVVHDNGTGGADAAKGSGLQGIRRRLAAFDGRLTLTSPIGGPTTAAIEITLDPADVGRTTG
ncbi:sensor histidine kinase [Nocardia sp. NPDC051570]|uniref:sensor histidine kinase n=1 Tax=Nocardia sp. NPDC051570 TaxID=3364324 RepID=UPI0037B0B6E6